MLSRASLLFILKSGCLNSHACSRQPLLQTASSHVKSYPHAIRRCPSFLIIVPNLVKVVFVQLPYEAGEVAVLEVFRQDVFRELLVLQIFSAVATSNKIARSFPTSSTTKLSPSFPHLTTLSSCGLSSILFTDVSTRAFIARDIHPLVELAHLRWSVKLSSHATLECTYKIARAVGRLALRTCVHPCSPALPAHSLSLSQLLRSYSRSRCSRAQLSGAGNRARA